MGYQGAYGPSILCRDNPKSKMDRPCLNLLDWRRKQQLPMQQHLTLICQLIPFPDPMTAASEAKMTVIHHHHQIRREQHRLPLPPPPPMVRPPRSSSSSGDPPIFTSLAASTLPRNFWHQHTRGQQQHMPRPLSVTIRRPPRSFMNSSEGAAVQLPSPPDPPSFALSALVRCSFTCHAKRPLWCAPLKLSVFIWKLLLK